MAETTDRGSEGGAPEAPPRSVPMAALAGAVILIGLVGLALYRRGATPAVAPAAAPAAEDGAAAADPGSGATIAAQAPYRLSPEASILAERYRCICGCNDTLSVCTCRNPRGSEDMKRALQALADQGKTPEESDAAMQEQFGAVALLKNPAPPQTLPSHATGAPPPARRP